MDFAYALQSLNATALLDIFIVAVLLYVVSLFLRGTQAMSLLRGLALVIGGLVLISSLLNLTALQWILANMLTVLAVGILIIFQPEIRRALERLGRAGIWFNRAPAEDRRQRLIEQLGAAVERLSERRHGALIVLERNVSTEEFQRTGVLLNAEVSPQILLTIFWPKTELHDGAVIVSRDGLISAAACVLPLSGIRSISGPKLGTRHRAAIGMSEVGDAIVIVVSEETGRISIANGGRLISRLDGARLRTILNALYFGDDQANAGPLQRIRDSIAAVSGRSRVQQTQKNL